MCHFEQMRRHYSLDDPRMLEIGGVIIGNYEDDRVQHFVPFNPKFTQEQLGEVKLKRQAALDEPTASFNTAILSQKTIAVDETMDKCRNAIQSAKYSVKELQTIIPNSSLTPRKCNILFHIEIAVAKISLAPHFQFFA